MPAAYSRMVCSRMACSRAPASPSARVRPLACWPEPPRRHLSGSRPRGWQEPPGSRPGRPRRGSVRVPGPGPRGATRRVRAANGRDACHRLCPDRARMASDRRVRASAASPWGCGEHVWLYGDEMRGAPHACKVAASPRARRVSAQVRCRSGRSLAGLRRAVIDLDLAVPACLKRNFSSVLADPGCLVQASWRAFRPYSDPRPVISASVNWLICFGSASDVCICPSPSLEPPP